MTMSIASLEPRFKELLYRCLEEIRATKAALYLAEGDEDYQLVTHYGFREGLKPSHKSRDELVNMVIVKRAPFFANSLTEEAKFSELLYDAGTTRILVAPIYSRGRLVGFLDIRDKAASEPFSTKDMAKAQAITDAYLELFAEQGLFGQKKIAVSDSPTMTSVTVYDESGFPPIVDRARSELQRIASGSEEAAEAVPSPNLDVTRSMLGLFLSLRGVVAAGLADLSGSGENYYLTSRTPISDAVAEEIMRRFGIWMQKKGGKPPALAIHRETWFENGGAPPTPGQIKSLMAAPLRDFPHLVLSVVFDDAPDDDARASLERLHRCVEQSVENSVAARSRIPILERVAYRLIEPDLSALPDLVDHSKRVATMSDELARKVQLSHEEVERIRLAALVHDVGMRPIGWERIQRKGALSDAEIKLVRQHPLVGAAIVSRSALGKEIGRVVHSHHEWVDGSGYPDGLSGDQIPVGSRIIHIAEAFDAMTAPHSYKAPVSVREACARLSQSKGKQFDPELVDAFVALRT